MTTTTPATWARPRPGRDGLRADGLGAILLALGAGTSSLLYQRVGIFNSENLAEPWLWIAGLALTTLPLALRRRYPVPVALVVTAGFFVCGQFGVPEALFINISLFIAVYTIGAWESRRALAFWSRFGITAAMIVWVVVDLLLSVDSEALPGLSRAGFFSAYATFAVIQVITNLMYFGGAIFFGERSWRSARGAAQLEAQGHELDLERRTSAEQAVALERLSIARELHDVVAHHVSVMGIQAAAARRSLERNPEDTGRAVEAIGTIEESARSAVDELRRLVGTLRSPENEGGASTVGIAQLPVLVAEARSAGTPTALIVAGEPRPLPMLVDVGLYRVVQESLTNVRKHAGRGAQAEVRLRFSPNGVEVEVSDDGVRQSLRSSAGGSEGGGAGLIGMRERIGAVGGTVHAGRRERGGFMVRASVPLLELDDGSARAFGGSQSGMSVEHTRLPGVRAEALDSSRSTTGVPTGVSPPSTPLRASTTGGGAGPDGSTGGDGVRRDDSGPVAGGTASGGTADSNPAGSGGIVDPVHSAAAESPAAGAGAALAGGDADRGEAS